MKADLSFDVQVLDNFTENLQHQTILENYNCASTMLVNSSWWNLFRCHVKIHYFLYSDRDLNTDWQLDMTVIKIEAKTLDMILDKWKFHNNFPYFSVKLVAPYGNCPVDRSNLNVFLHVFSINESKLPTTFICGVRLLTIETIVTLPTISVPPQ